MYKLQKLNRKLAAVFCADVEDSSRLRKGGPKMNYKYLRLRTVDRVGWIEYNHPPINAFNWEMLREVPAALEAMLNDCHVRVIVFASTIEKYFSTGADLKVFDGFGAKEMAAENTSSSSFFGSRKLKYTRSMASCLSSTVIGVPSR